VPFFTAAVDLPSLSMPWRQLSVWGAVLGGYLALRPEEKLPIKLKAVPPWKSIAERMIQAEQGQFPTSDGTLTFSTGPAATDAEIRSVIGTFELPRYGAAQIESGESWGITGANRDEFVMYVHNFLNAPITAMVLRISEGTCDSFGPQSKTTWASAYWADALGGGQGGDLPCTLCRFPLPTAELLRGDTSELFVSYALSEMMRRREPLRRATSSIWLLRHYTDAESLSDGAPCALVRPNQVLDGNRMAFAH
jgi:hypothetical protein